MEKQLQGNGHLLQGRTAYIAVAGTDSGSEIAVALKRQGARVALLGEQPDTISDLCVLTGFDSRACLSQAFDRAIERLGAPDLTVICVSPVTARRPCSLDQHTDKNWDSNCQAPLRSTLHCIQAAAAAMAHQGGAMVLLGPTVGYTGATGLVALSALTEGQRGLAKSAARQLGAKGITVNWLALASSRLYPELDGLDLPQVPEMGPPPLPLGSAPTLEQAMSVVAFLGSASGRVLTGASLALDGGEWMLP